MFFSHFLQKLYEILETNKRDAIKELGRSWEYLIPCVCYVPLSWLQLLVTLLHMSDVLSSTALLAHLL